jgi:mannose-1-phosphate guanylyltransferase/mannose-6-phosphate isomerase
VTQPDDDFKAIIPVILAGGKGMRLRPLTNRLPKPFLRLRAPHTLLQQTVLRASGMAAPAIVANAEHRPRIVTDMAAINVATSQIFLEPEGRNTAPALAAGAHYFTARGADPLLLVLPADHAIRNTDALEAAIKTAIPAARAGRFVLFGVKPTRPATGYGYIKRGASIEGNAFTVEAFTEKPDAATARSYIAAGNYDWNSGIFLLSAATFLTRLKELDPGLYQNSYQSVARASRLQNSVYLEKTAFASCPHISIDRAVMEKSDNLTVIPVDMGWRDLGTWQELIRHALTRPALRAA